MYKTGIYEKLITEVLDRHLNHECFYVGERELTENEASLWLSRFIANLFEYAVSALPAGKDKLERQIEFSNQFILWLKEKLSGDDFIESNLISCRAKILTALYELENPIAHNLKKYAEDIYPKTGLSQSELFSGSNAGISLDSELKREILSADEIYWIVSFVKWTGIRIFRKELEEFVSLGRQIKIITTSYMGATDAKAIEYLAGLPNVEIKISYNTEHERLHAKSYLFLRETGYHTGYIGSSNLSRSALTNGLEWNLKITSQEIPHIIDKTINTFDTYWNSSDFEFFDGGLEAVNKLNKSLKDARGHVHEKSTYFFDVKPFPHQKELLEQLRVERELYGRFRNLLVAATGTGKTLMSAFDFAEFYRAKPDAKLLFIAHREEILKQSRDAYRGVLKRAEFGELWVGIHKPDSFQHLFVSVQTFNNQLSKLRLSPEFYDYIVIDEVHHISAKSYRQIVDYFKPAILLGLTATPERHDESDILEDFCGVIGAEIRLPEAINRRHLCPFQYFIVDDDTDLRNISWNKGRYDISQLTNLYTHNQSRVNKIISSLRDVVTDISSAKALAFCVSKDHAVYMAKQFCLKGIKSDVLTSDNSHERQQKHQSIRSGEINILCVVDIFNEGVDIPEIDTLLFLRPTESLTIFLQQLGRGLRLSAGKECCTILDFVGNSRPEYDYANKFRSLVGKTNTPIAQEVEDGFCRLPLGCRIELTRQAQSLVLSQIRQATQASKKRLIGLIRSFSSITNLSLSLGNFLKINTNLHILDIYKRGSWAELVEHALSSDKEPISSSDLFSVYKKAIKNRFLVCDDVNYLKFILSLIQNDFAYDPKDILYALMCHYDFWGDSGLSLGFDGLGDSFNALRHAALEEELEGAVFYQISQIHHHQAKMPNLADVPLLLHARYAREQILVAFGVSTFVIKFPAREGVLVVKEKNYEILFVTLDKNEKQFSPTTMYHDYAINDSLFHWQSQNSAFPEKGKGLEYINHRSLKKRIFLFVRERAKDEFGRTIGFVNFGEVEYVSHAGARPMNITWRLLDPMPSYMWSDAAKLAVG